MIDWTLTSRLDRALEARTIPGGLASLWAEPGARLLRVGSGRVRLAEAGLSWEPCAGPYDPQRHFLLGLVEGSPVFVAAGADDAPSLRERMEGLPDPELELAFAAVGLVGWHLRSTFCAECGARTEAIAGGQARRCTGCAAESYPRTDPAVIVAITDPDDRLLLGRQASWAPGLHSVFAGFAEIGESLEQTVHREMAEEVGLALTDVRYLGSQPWPFPRSLMVGFAARTASAELTVAEEEIEVARWFSRDGLRAAFASGEVLPPSTTSIAARMIQAWLDDDLSPEGLSGAKISNSELVTS
ncbi:NAD+ diphosphatase [Propionicimonas paludicola]|uniref:NAD(+) diphosphatase n=1 Tax=Propionicimonas paludicola TaxID=185243 RepID=A0A2A9CTD7_9ACTN|nr:NAD(+) diphosphatase [Propionicimonas paludicola]PFG16882.1 NAD+ diphosphatase [Propionicimonas paludicola]